MIIDATGLACPEPVILTKKALATHPDDIKAKIEITDEQWHHYIHGETITIEETKDKGWYLLVCQGHSISFSKLVGKTLKNFYPKGLRV